MQLKQVKPDGEKLGRQSTHADFDTQQPNPFYSSLDVDDAAVESSTDNVFLKMLEVLRKILELVASVETGKFNSRVAR